MAVNSISEIVSELNKLDSKKQQKVLEYKRLGSNNLPRGVPGSAVLKFAGSIDHDELQLMTKAIEAGCERIDANEW